jgi:hypothetical protein
VTKRGRSKRIRIRGLVRAARQAQERLLAGVPTEERKSFQESLLGAVSRAREICRRAGTRPRSLPKPSRNALAELERIASIPAEQLPLPREGAAPVFTIRIHGLESGLARILDTLGRSGADPLELETALAGAASLASSARAICAEKNTNPAGLPLRTRRAFLMLEWLGERGNFDLYRRQALSSALALAEGSRPRKPLRPFRTEVAFLPGEHIYRLHKSEALHRWRLGLGYLEAGEEDFRTLAHWVRAGRRARDEVEQAYRSFVNAPEFHRLDRALELSLESRWEPRGRTRDLDLLFDRLNNDRFGGTLERPGLHWAPTLSRTVFGTYTDWLDLVCINPVLDDPAVPEWVPELVLYHELLHKKHGLTFEGRRRIWHSPAFRAEERLHPRYPDARRWLDTFGVGPR